MTEFQAPHIDPTISVGVIIQTITFLLAGIIGYTKLIARIATLETKVETLWNKFVHRNEG